MSFAVQKRTQPGVTGRDPTVYMLCDGAAGRAEVWPALGFNCFHWETVRDGRTLDLLYSDPALFGDGRPTRSGIPILFPFPNRIRDGRFTWQDKQYTLPTNDPSGKNAIHGFACRRPWRVVDQGADAVSAWVTGEFQASRDAPDCLPLWPADYLIRITCRLGVERLRVEAEVENPDRNDLPFGLGYHPYYRLPFASGDLAADGMVRTPAKQMWPLVDSLPIGERQPVDSARDLQTPRLFGDLQLDDVLTGLPGPDADGLCDRGAVQSGRYWVALRASPAFREAVVFTPPHRQAFCIEPYSCTTDAVNLQQRGVDAGLLTLRPGGRWTAIFEMRIDSDIQRANS
ncbi:MAG TPA: aldose 1-epimerase [Gemmataceae bacterium]|nr:aldose 1-epimerase [Gemmataceae bacterium]